MTSTRAGFVALIGPPNAGKSTLLNRIIGTKIAAVTHKAQTTRARLRGIAIQDNTQIIFVDTPGIFAPRKRLEKAMVADAWMGVGDSDIVLLMLDAQRGEDAAAFPIFDALIAREKKRTVALVLNKVDNVNRAENLLPLSAALNARCHFEKTFMISAKSGSGVDGLMRWLCASMPEGAFLYDADQIADQSLNVIAADITREQLMLRLHEEIPYQLSVEPESWRVLKDGSLRIEQVIYVARAGHRGIIIGKGGQVLKAVSTAARLQISALVGQPVHLFLRIKHAADWQNQRERYSAIGLEFPTKK